jgi:hypothetical protein
MRQALSPRSGFIDSEEVADPLDCRELDFDEMVIVVIEPQEDDDE